MNMLGTCIQARTSKGTQPQKRAAEVEKKIKTDQAITSGLMLLDLRIKPMITRF